MFVCIRLVVALKFKITYSIQISIKGGDITNSVSVVKSTLSEIHEMLEFYYFFK